MANSPKFKVNDYIVPIKNPNSKIYQIKDIIYYLITSEVSGIRRDNYIYVTRKGESTPYSGELFEKRCRKALPSEIILYGDSNDY